MRIIMNTVTAISFTTNNSGTKRSSEILDTIQNNHKGQFFSIVYVGYNGIENKVNGRVLRHKPIKKHIANTYKVYDRNARKYVVVPFDRVIEYKVGGKTVQV